MTPAVATSRQKVVHILTKGENKALLLLLLLLVLYVSVLGAKLLCFKWGIRIYPREWSN
jgi:hypothetical protein